MPAPPYPTLVPPQGVGWDYKLSPKFSTITQTPQSGRGPISATLQQGTIFEIELVWNYLKCQGVTFDDDFEYLKSFYEAMRGSWGRFLFDPSTIGYQDLSLTQDLTQLKNGFCGTGDGGTTVFPMWRSTAALGNGIVTLLERIQNIDSLLGVYVNGVLQQPGTYSVSNLPGVITFNSAPAAGTPIAWAGTYNYLVHFDDDSIDFSEFMQNLWELKSLKLETINL